jgi:ectoine hydroxylase-related dioxygenase (phytanoyl-CoA dioxygenase family)
MLGLRLPTESDRAGFARDGVVVMRAALDADATADLQRWAAEVAALPEISGRHWVFHERSSLDPARALIERIERIVPFHAGFAALCAALAAPVAALLGEPAVLFKEKINFKMPGGGGFKPHQDSQAGWEAYASTFITAVVSIDRSTVANGCLQIAAGHQRRGLFRAWEPLSDADMAGMMFVDCPTEPGDIALLDSYTPHASEPNRSAEIRRLYFATYNRLSEGDHSEHYYADKHRSYPPDIDREPGRRYVFRV